ncbi:hypothetical protein D3C81_1878330 [compost metagenome]
MRLFKMLPADIVDRLVGWSAIQIELPYPLLHICSLGEIGINQFRQRILLFRQQLTQGRKSFLADNLQHFPAVRFHGLIILPVLAVKG